MWEWWWWDSLASVHTPLTQPVSHKQSKWREWECEKRTYYNDIDDLKVRANPCLSSETEHSKLNRLISYWRQLMKNCQLIYFSKISSLPSLTSDWLMNMWAKVHLSQSLSLTFDVTGEALLVFLFSSEFKKLRLLSKQICICRPGLLIVPVTWTRFHESIAPPPSRTSPPFPWTCSRWSSSPCCCSPPCSPPSSSQPHWWHDQWWAAEAAY